ncbi:hypothetical protein F0562_017342 [Nyssa sinensis]|uniref:ABC transporter domain-containing protein n=1 Tax=Nyssa sinensis TaxID=561372 RepID=A0A5J4ZEB1_9ASTE|nr:hypothetical protein F0562_017342 [Nyssa sinensis]
MRKKKLQKKMEKSNSTRGLLRTKSDQFVEKVTAAMAAMKSSTSTSEAAGGPESSGTLSRKFSSKRLAAAISPGGASGSSKHIRKCRSAQMRLEFDDVSSSAALRSASSASLGFSFTGITVPPDEIPDLRTFSDDDTAEDIEAGTRKKMIHIEPTLPIYLKFTDVTYKVILKGVRSTVEKVILNGITGSVNPGEVLALMGPSGSGKTTLLSLLGGRTKEPTPGGSITYNDQPYSKFLKSRIGFVTQDDVLFPHLTEKEKRATDVICELGLERCRDTMIGGSFVRGVSGGERKRVCIGNEIIINPSLLFLDEPTSGLDSTTALRIVEMLHDIAEGYSPLIAMNPAEFLLDLANGNINDVSVPSELEDKVQMGNSETETRNGKPSPAVVHEYLVEAYETRVADNEKKKLMVPIPIDEELKLKVSSTKREWGASWWEQFSILFWRGLKERRHDYFSWLRITQVVSTAIILGLLWWQSDSNSPNGLQDQVCNRCFVKAHK